MKWIQLSFAVVLLSVVSALNFDPDDWYVIKKMGSISSITEDNYSIYILADNGIFTVDKSSGDIEYSVELSDIFYNPQIIYPPYSDGSLLFNSDRNTFIVFAFKQLL